MVTDMAKAFDGVQFSIRALVLFGLFYGDMVFADSVQVAVASNFQGAFESIAKGFEADTGHKAVMIPGATGKLYAQITNGAPFEVLLSADQETPSKLEKAGLAVNGTRFTYAIGRLVLWSSKAHFVDDAGRILFSPSFDHLSIANPKTAPYGTAAMAVLRKLKLENRLSAKLVQGENISQAHQFVVSGNAQLGFVALSQVYKDGQLTSGSVWFIPNDDYPPLRQDALLLRAGEKNPAATALLAYLKSPVAKDVMTSLGYHY